jgi:hypothetical protein
MKFYTLNDCILCELHPNKTILKIHSSH